MNAAANGISRDHANGSKEDLDLWVLALLLAFPSTGFVQKYAGLVGVIGYVPVLVAMMILSACLTRRFTPWLGRHFHRLALLSVAVLAAGYVGLHPIEDGRGAGKSSDRDEGLELAVTRMMHGQYPYYPQNDQAGPLSVLPGSILLATPFVICGDVGFQNVFWLAAFLIVARRWLRDGARALFLLTLPLAISPAALYEWISGGDLIANGIFVALAVLGVAWVWSKETTSAWSRWLSCLALGIALASRANFLLLLPVILGVLWRLTGPRRAITACVVTGLATVAAILPFYLHNPAGFTPLITREKISFANPELWWLRHLVIVTTLLSACFGAAHLILSRSVNPVRLCLRWCAITTLVPVLLMVALSSLLNRTIDFSFLRDRFGLMYVFFALFGWGGARLSQGEYRLTQGNTDCHKPEAG